MPEWLYITLAVLISAAITWALRAVPFLLIERIRESDLLQDLNVNMPVGIMTILVFYTLRHTDVLHAAPLTATVAGLGITAAIHWWRRGPVLAVLAGTVVHVGILTLAG